MLLTCAKNKISPQCTNYAACKSYVMEAMVWYNFTVYNGICCLIEAKFTRHTLSATMTTSRIVFRASEKQI